MDLCRIYKFFFLGVLLATFFGFTWAQDVELEQQVFKIARQLRCPVCRAESAADSNATSSVEFRNIIQEQLTAGKSETKILAFFKERYGDWILLDPPKEGLHLIVWILPIVAGLIAFLILIVLFQKWLKKTKVPLEVPENDLVRVRQALQDAGKD